jgi:outer membrane autotransporter protein
MHAFERVSLQSGSVLTLANTLPLSGGVLAIDAASMLHSQPGAEVSGSVENAGTVRIDGGRLAIAGNYTGSGQALLQLAVSPGTGTSGGMDIGGDVRGTTRIAFETDGTVATQPTSIKVIDSPNDVPGEGTFVASRSSEGFVRLPGSVLNWGFAQDAADGDWYLRTEAFGEEQLGLLPEVPGYGVLPTTTLLAARGAGQRAFDHLGSTRDMGRCGRDKNANPATRQPAIRRLHGAWASVSAEEVEVGANPGAAFSGDHLSLFLGADIFGHASQANAFRGGVFVGLQRGDYWTTGEKLLADSRRRRSNVRTETHAFGAYGAVDWNNGWHLDATAVGQLNEGTVKAPDGFSQDLVGESLGLHVRTGRAFETTSGWRIDPQLTLGAIDLHWRDVIDGSGKVVHFADDLVGTARAEVRAERGFDTAAARIGNRGSSWAWKTASARTPMPFRCWQRDGTAQRFPNHASGLAATLDLGVELRTSATLSWFRQPRMGPCAGRDRHGPVPGDHRRAPCSGKRRAYFTPCIHRFSSGVSTANTIVVPEADHHITWNRCEYARRRRRHRWRRPRAHDRSELAERGRQQLRVRRRQPEAAHHQPDHLRDRQLRHRRQADRREAHLADFEQEIREHQPPHARHRAGADGVGGSEQGQERQGREQQADRALRRLAGIRTARFQPRPQPGEEGREQQDEERAEERQRPRGLRHEYHVAETRHRHRPRPRSRPAPSRTRAAPRSLARSAITINTGEPAISHTDHGSVPLASLTSEGKHVLGHQPICEREPRPVGLLVQGEETPARRG